jgi:hypothetical protein
MEALPRNALGKVKRGELATALHASLSGKGFLPPRDGWELRVAAVFAEVLRLDHPVSVLDDFFALGGDSLRATQAIARLNESTESKLGADSLFRRPTVAQLAAELAAGAGGMELGAQ